MATSTLPLVFREDSGPKYDWFGAFDYSWFDSPGNLSTVPYFEATPELLGHVLRNSTARQELTLGFVPHDCTTNGRYHVDRSDKMSVETMDSLCIPDPSTFNATAALSHVAECISQSCVVSRLGQCSDDVRSLGAIEIQASNLEVMNSRLTQYCEGTHLGFSADIAGPGILVSYFVQSSIALLFYLLLKASTTWLPGLNTLLSRRVKQDGDHSQSTLSAMRPRLESSRIVQAVTSLFVEFQEAQTYFIVAVQIATFISYNPAVTDTAGLNDSSYASLLFDAGLAGLLNIMSVSSVLLVQCCLQRAHMYWWYTFFMVTSTCALAVVLFSIRSSLLPPADGLWERFKADAPLPLCGGNPSPMTYCRPSRESAFLDNAVSGYVVSGHIALAWPALFIDLLAFTICKKYPAVANRLKNIDRKGIFQRQNKPWRAISLVYWFMLELLLPCLVVYNIVTLVFVLQGVSIGGGSNWSFGQVISVAVWAPTIVKFIYSNTFGVKASFEERIPRSHTITRDHTTTRDDEVTDAQKSVPDLADNTGDA